MSKTAAIPRRESSPTRHVVTSLSADELLETLRQFDPALRDQDAADRADTDAGPRSAIVICCGARPRAIAAARSARAPGALGLPAHATAVEPVPLAERFGFSDRQAEVARLLAAGHSNAEIGERLGLSTYTARNHAARVLHKLGIRRRSGVGMAILGETDEHMDGSESAVG